MKKKYLFIIVVILFVIGVFSTSVSWGDFFFTTKYYKTPIKAYNSSATYSAITGDISAKKEIGLISLDNENCLFVGEIDDYQFVVAEMSLHNGRYATKGILYFYDKNQTLDETDTNVTKISNGYINWSIFYNKLDAQSVANSFSVEILTLSDGTEIYVVLEQVN